MRPRRDSAEGSRRRRGAEPEDRREVRERERQGVSRDGTRGVAPGAPKSLSRLCVMGLKLEIKLGVCYKDPQHRPPLPIH